jgi:polyhydroxyalkanoate synthase
LAAATSLGKPARNALYRLNHWLSAAKINHSNPLDRRRVKGMSTQDEQIKEEAAESTVALSPIVGLSRQDLVEALGVVVRQSALQPGLFVKHLTAYGRDLADIAQGKSELTPAVKDRRFQDPAWRDNAVYRAGLQSWLAMRNQLSSWVDGSDLNDIDRTRATFILNLIGDALAPTNSLVGNPSAIKKFIDTGGMSLIRGMSNAYDDLRNNGGLPAQVDKRPFKVGENLATSEGAVVFRNDMLELIQYKPLTEKVHQRPILSIPPQINKFYVSDLTPEKSMFQHLLKQGLQVFAVSWRNPTKQHAQWGLEDYVQSIFEAIDATLKVTRQKNLNITGACSGGITVAAMLSYLSAVKDTRINAVTMMVSVLDPQKDDSEIGAFVSDRAIEFARRRSASKGILSGEDLAQTFAWLRPNDLIWNYVVNNYLHGEAPPPFDILYWNNDSTNLTAKLHSDYLRLYQQQPFANPGSVEFMGKPLDLMQVTHDVFVVGGITDHITPWRACYRSALLFGGKVEFNLSNSGHIQSLLNPPGNPKAKYFSNPNMADTPEEWLENAELLEGSWWVRWGEWLKERSDELKNAPKSLGNKAHPPLDKAPGKYVFD